MPYFGSRGSITEIAMPDFGSAAPYPYSKMCELCELCELLERKIPPLCDGIFLFIRSRIYSLAEESCEVPSDEDSALAES